MLLNSDSPKSVARATELQMSSAPEITKQIRKLTDQTILKLRRETIIKFTNKTIISI